MAASELGDVGVPCSILDCERKPVDTDSFTGMLISVELRCHVSWGRGERVERRHATRAGRRSSEVDLTREPTARAGISARFFLGHMNVRENLTAKIGAHYSIEMLCARAGGASMKSRTSALVIFGVSVVLCANAAAGVDRVPIWDTVQTLDTEYVRGQVDAAGYGPNNQIFYSIDKISAHNHVAAEWNCAFVFMLDRSRAQITILHSEGNGAEPSEINVNVGKLSDIAIRGAWDMTAVADAGYGTKSYANQPIHWRIFVVDRESRAVVILHYLTHQYDARGMRVSGAKYWTTSTIGAGVVERPSAIASFSDNNTPDNAFVIVDELDGSICVVGTDNALFGKIDMAALGFSDFITSNVDACNYGNERIIAVVGDENGRSRLVLLSSPDRGFDFPNIVGSWLFDEVVDVSLTSELGLWALLGSGRGFARSHDGVESYDVEFSNALTAAPKCIAASGQFVYPVAAYGVGSGLEKYRPTDALRVATSKRKYYSDLEPAVCEYGIQEAATYRLQMKIADGSSVHWYDLGNSDFGPGPHMRSVALPSPSSGSSFGWFVLNKDSGGGAPLQLISEPFLVSRGPTGGFITPVDGAQFRSGTRSTTVEFGLDYGTGSMASARAELIKRDTGVIVRSAAISVPTNGVANVTMNLPTDDDCWADLYSMRLIAEYGSGPQSKLLETIDVSVRKLDGCDGGDDPGTPMDPAGTIAGARAGGGASDDVIIVTSATESVSYRNGQLVVVAGDAGIERLSVYDLRGRKLLSRDTAALTTPMSQISLGERFASGFYFARLYRKDGTYVSRKFVVVK